MKKHTAVSISDSQDRIGRKSKDCEFIRNIRAYSSFGNIVYKTQTDKSVAIILQIQSTVAERF